MSDLAIAQPTSIQIADNPIGRMMQQLADKGTPESVSAMKELTQLYLQVEAENSKRIFNAARCQLLAEIPRIVARKPVHNSEEKGGGLRYVYAPYEEIKAAIDPYLVKHGFSISFSTRIDDNGKKDRIVAICKLQHVAGHSESNEFAVRVSGPPGTNDAQADGSTLSYAKRYALCMMLDITIDHDTDARIEGGYIDAVQVASLKKRVRDTGSDEARFLKMARAESFEKIRQGNYAMLSNALSKKESANQDKKDVDEVKEWAKGAVK